MLLYFLKAALRPLVNTDRIAAITPPSAALNICRRQRYLQTRTGIGVGVREKGRATLNMGTP